MPAYIGLEAVINGVDSVPYFWPIVKSIPWLVALFLAKVFFGGASNTSERNLHGKVVLVTVSSCKPSRVSSIYSH